MFCVEVFMDHNNIYIYKFVFIFYSFALWITESLWCVEVQGYVLKLSVTRPE